MRVRCLKHAPSFNRLTANAHITVPQCGLGDSCTDSVPVQSKNSAHKRLATQTRRAHAGETRNCLKGLN